MTMQERIAKLPRWAQLHIAYLQRLATEAEERARTVFAEVPEKERRIRVDLAYRSEPVYLPAGAAITFRLGDGDLA